MAHRTAAVLLIALLLVALSAFAQHRSSGTVGISSGQTTITRGGGVFVGGGIVHGRGVVTGGAPGAGVGLAPQLGFGNINHPGLGYAPNTPGIGYPLTPGVQPLPLGTQPLPTGGVFHGGFRGHGRRGHFGVPVVVPYAVPVYMGGFGFGVGYNSVTTTGYGYGYGLPSPPPTVIVIQNDSGQARSTSEAPVETWAGPTRVLPEQSSGIYEVRGSGDAPAVTNRPLTLLVFKDNSIYAVTDYWRENDRLCYITNYGARTSIPFEQLNLEFTRKLNAERGIEFRL